MRRDWLGLVIRMGFGAVVGLGCGVIVSMVSMGMNADWMMLLIPTAIGVIWGARSDG